LIDVAKIVEKPAVDLARRELRVDGLGADEFLGWFGMHWLTPGIFEMLDRMFREDRRDRGEFQLTRAQDLLREAEGYCAIEIVDGERFDFGAPDDYVASLSRYRGSRITNVGRP